MEVDKKKEKKEEKDKPEEAKKVDTFIDKAAAELEEEQRRLKQQKNYLPEVKAALPAILDPVQVFPSVGVSCFHDFFTRRTPPIPLTNTLLIAFSTEQPFAS